MNIALPRSGNQRDLILFAAIAISIGLHALVLAVHFVTPDAIRFKPSDEKLDVILVNSKGPRPVKAQALAQVDSNGGGNQDQGRATSFLPRSAQAADGDSVLPPEEQAQLAALEARQQQLLAQLKPTATVVNPAPAKDGDTTVQPTDAADNGQLRTQIARMEAEVSKEISDYNARPRRVQIGPNTRQSSFAMYYVQWIDRVERFGNVNYPEEARGKFYGDLVLQVTLNQDGSIYNDEINIMRSSGYKVLDRAARRTVAMAAPYAPFDNAMRNEFTVYELIVKFTYTKGDGFEARFEKH